MPKESNRPTRLRRTSIRIPPKSHLQTQPRRLSRLLRPIPEEPITLIFKDGRPAAAHPQLRSHPHYAGTSATSTTWTSPLRNSTWPPRRRLMKKPVSTFSSPSSRTSFQTQGRPPERSSGFLHHSLLTIHCCSLITAVLTPKSTRLCAKYGGEGVSLPLPGRRPRLFIPCATSLHCPKLQACMTSTAPLAD